jgi:hypothetical protein
MLDTGSSFGTFPASELLENTFFGFARVTFIKKKQIQSYAFLRKMRNLKKCLKKHRFTMYRILVNSRASSTLLENRAEGTGICRSISWLRVLAWISGPFTTSPNNFGG